jgi:hypothetical protein
MKLPIQSPPVYRMATSPMTIQVSASGVIMSRNKYTTGKCVCKKGSSIKFTADSTICTSDDHKGCTNAKDACLAEHRALCNREGGILTHSEVHALLVLNANKTRRLIIVIVVAPRSCKVNFAGSFHLLISETV